MSRLKKLASYVFFLAGMIFVALSVGFFLHERAVKSWPQVTAVMDRVQVERYTSISDGQTVVMYRPDVAFSYTVDGNRYSATTLASYTMSSSIAAQIETRLAEFPLGEQVTAFVSPTNPEKAYLMVGDAVFWTMFLGGAVLFFAAGLAFWFLPDRWFSTSNKWDFHMNDDLFDRD